MKLPVLVFLSLFFLAPLFSQTTTEATPKVQSSKNWSETISLRGYAQIRYNRLLETNPNLKCESCDRSIGEGGGFMLRRMRLIFSGQIHPRVYMYVQPDFATSVGTSLHLGQIRDAYFDLGADKNNEFRFRLGQSKVPFGFENMQSSSNRLPLDRNDAVNSGVPNERDFGAFFYWAPKRVRSLFPTLIKDGLKGSGDYGVFAVGAYNGQTTNKSELNNTLHIVSRLTYPFRIKKQIIEPGIQAYTGQYTLATDQLSSGVKAERDLTYLDSRQGASFVLYPQPFGIQAEYNIGKGPEFNPATDSIELRKLKGGYVTLNYKTQYKGQLFYPFLRYQQYQGGKKK